MSSKRRQSRRERKKERTRTQIVEAAEDLYNVKPFDEVTMDEIAERADLSRGTIYNHFKSREQLILELGINNIRKIMDRQLDRLSPQQTGFNQIGTLFRDLMNGFLSNPLDHKIWHYFLQLNNRMDVPADVNLDKMRQGLQIDDETELWMARYLNEIIELEKMWIETIEKGYEDGTIRRKYDSDKLAHFLFTLISGIINAHHIEKYQLEKADLQEGIITEMTLEALGMFLRVA